MVEDAADAITVSKDGFGEGVFNLACEIPGHLFVGVEEQDPCAGRVVEGNLFLLDVIGKFLFKDARAQFLGDGDCTISGEGIDENEFVAKSRATEALADQLLFVASDDDEREGWSGGHGNKPALVEMAMIGRL